MAIAEILFRVNTAGEGEQGGFGLLVGVGFEAQKSLDTLQGIPERRRSGPNVGGAGFVSLVKVPLIGSRFYQDNGRELIERIFFEPAAKREAAGFRQAVVKENQIRLELTAIADRGIGIVGGDYIAMLLLKESF